MISSKCDKIYTKMDIIIGFCSEDTTGKPNLDENEIVQLYVLLIGGIENVMGNKLPFKC